VVDEPVMAGAVMVHEPVPRREAGRARMARHASEALHLMAGGEPRGSPATHLGERGRRCYGQPAGHGGPPHKLLHCSPPLRSCPAYDPVADWGPTNRSAVPPIPALAGRSRTE